ncbi:MAG: hypothetical protein R3D30_13490 [Hyphomicrobiales bacterium]
MGGHALKRTDAIYREVVKIGQALIHNDYLPMTGGGRGLEAVHLGAGSLPRPFTIDAGD